jgi:DNA modification methylase
VTILDRNERFRIVFGDCVEGLRELPQGSIHLVVSSPPFGSLFTYSGKNEDVGNNQDGVDMEGSMFGLHMRMWAQELLRVTMPGRNACLHIQQLLAYKNQHGFMGRRDFRGALIEIMTKAGWVWVGEVAIPKNPQIMAKRLSLHSLMFATGKRDAVMLAPAVNDYLMVFQAPGENKVPVPCLFDRHKNPNGWVSTDDWIKWASGCWDDVKETDVLENHRDGRDEGDEKHVCPLQLEVIRRPVLLYTNPGEIVLDPFMGIGSTAWVALKEGRRAIGFELKESYHALAVRNAGRACGLGLPQGALDFLEVDDAAA